MAPPRVDNAPDKQALKAASKALVRAVGGVEAAAEYCRAGFRRLSEYGGADNECFMPIDVVADLEGVAHGTAGYPQVTRFLAREAGFALVKLPVGETPTGDTLLAAIAEQSRSANAVTAGMLDALADHVVTPAEARREMEQCFVAAERVMRLHALLSQIAEV